MTRLITPVILSGGMGTRLWPMSRVEQPKQFQPVDGEGGPSFLQSTVLRHRGAPFSEPLLVASAREEALVERQLSEIGVDHRFIGEPIGRNTGPAVLSAALVLAEQDPGALLLVLPSDHTIDGDMNTTVAGMAAAAEAGHIVLFGIVPRHAETGFGYIASGLPVEGTEGLHMVGSFIEKPEREIAEDLVAQGGTFWASGISMMRADVLIREFETYQPETLASVRAALAAARPVGRGVVLDEAAFAMALDEPTERQIFERSDRVTVAPLDVEWNDVGAWTAIHSISRKSRSGNVETGHVVSVDTEDSLIRASDKLVAVVGMRDVIVVDTPDALLVTNHANAQKVKEAVTRLKAENRREVLSHAPTPSEVAAAAATAAEAAEAEPGESDGQVARRTLMEGERLVVEGPLTGGAIVAVTGGTAQMINGGARRDCGKGQSLSVPPGGRLDVENRSSTPLELVTIDLSEGPEAAPTHAEIAAMEHKRALA